jgi:hypothetical protein
MGVTIPMVAIKAAQTSEAFNNKTRLAKYHSARRFVRAQGLVFALGLAKNEFPRAPGSCCGCKVGRTTCMNTVLVPCSVLQYFTTVL